MNHVVFDITEMAFGCGGRLFDVAKYDNRTVSLRVIPIGRDIEEVRVSASVISPNGLEYKVEARGDFGGRSLREMIRKVSDEMNLFSDVTGVEIFLKGEEPKGTPACSDDNPFTEED